MLDEHGDGLHHGGEYRAFDPFGRNTQRFRQQAAAAGFVSGRQDGQGQPGLDEGAQAVPPARLLIRQPGHNLLTVLRRRGGIAFAEMQLRSHQAKPHRRVAPADAELSGALLGSLQVGAGPFEVTHPQPDSCELPHDMRQVTPGTELVCLLAGFLESRDRGQVVPSQLGELSQLDEHGGRSPYLTQGAEGG